MIFIGGLGDQINLLVWARVSRPFFSFVNPEFSSFFVYQDIFKDFLHPAMSNQPILWFMLSILLSLFGQGFYSIFIILTLFANLFASYLFFKRFKHGFLYSLIFAFSAHFWIHVGVHCALMQIWFFPLFFKLFLDFQENLSTKMAFRVGLVLVFISLISNYYGFFLFVFSILYVVISFLWKLLLLKTFDIKFLLGNLRALGLSFALIFVLLLPHFRTTYLEEGDSAYALNRTFEDFVTFSSRPWYFVLPPVKNPFLGDITSYFVQRLEKTDYFLSDDYFPTEHSGNYFGITFLISFFLFLLYALVNGDLALREKIVLFLSIIFVLFLLMLPTFFTVSGIKIYTPGYFMYKFFPMFRVTARIGILVLICLLTAFGHAVEFGHLSENFHKGRVATFLYLLTFITLVETFVSVKFTRSHTADPVYEYLNAVTEKNAVFAVYPHEKTNDAFLNLSVHDRLLLNPREFALNSFNSAIFAKKIGEENDFSDFYKYNVEYFVVFGEKNCAKYKNYDADLSLMQEFDASCVFKVN